MLGERMHAALMRVESQARVALCASLGLACMFGGIWAGNAQAVAASGLASAVFVMRVCSILVYLAFFVISLRFARSHSSDLRTLFGVSSAVGIVAFAAGAVMLFAHSSLPALSDDVVSSPVFGFVALLLTKVIGAPISVGLACVFALLERKQVMRTCTLGMLGAFVAYSLVMQVGEQGVLSAGGSMAAAVVLLLVSLVCGMIGMEGASALTLRARKSHSPRSAALAVPGVVKRPTSKVVTPGFVMTVVFSAMMLGFLRNDLAGVDPHANPFSMVALLVLFAIAALWKGLRTEHVFYGALLFTAAGILLESVLDALSPGLSTLFCGLGMVLFEVVTWALVVYAARNSADTLLAASGVRAVAVLGHFAGTAIVAVVLLVGMSNEWALHASELIMIFVYVVMLLVLLKFPGLRAPFLAPVDASDYELGSVRAVEESEAHAAAESVEASGAGEVARAEMSESEEAADKRYWTEPCDTIAATYKLTAREREVFELMARGRDMPFMEEELCISRNTLKMHIRHIYTKLDIHSKQGIIDLVEQLVPNTGA